MSSHDPSGDRWAEIDRLFEAALERPASERRGFVEEACAGDRELRDRLRDLLRAAEDSEGHFEAPGPHASQAFIDDLGVRGTMPAAVGRYRVVRRLGRGGMGTVYLAEHEGEGFRQNVAIKILRRGIDTDDVMRRFVTERRILASLSHPNIARLFDGGTTADGRPYLVMEYVDGEPITSYCDRHQLTVRQRLVLVLEVIEAVKAAHANLVVHRDLKPSNILVTAEGRIKLLDFGIAKLLAPDAESDHTRTGLYLLTPDHASPEQLRGDPVTTATDVYQLGVLLFPLLTGGQAFRTPADPAAVRRHAAAHLDVPRPSSAVTASAEGEAVARARGTTPRQLRRELSGDLDTIVRQAARADPAQRYASAEELARDVRRFLDGRTISARPATWGYQARMFMRRHPWVAPGAGALLLFAGLFVAFQVRNTRALEAERNAARFEAERAQEVQQFLVGLFGSADPYTPADAELGRHITVLDALDVGTARLQETLADRPAVRAAILTSISEVYRSLGIYDKALPLREEARDLQAQVYGDTSRDVRDSMGALALIRGNLGLDGARELHERRLELALAADPMDDNEVADARVKMGRHLITLNRIEEAEAQLLATLALAERSELDPEQPAEAMRALSEVQRVLERHEEAEQTARRAVAMIHESFGAESPWAGFAHGTLAQALNALGRHDEADAEFRIGVELLERALGTEHNHVLDTKNNQAFLWMQSGRFDKAETLFRELVATLERRHGEGHPSTGLHLQNLGVVLRRQGRIDEARETFERVAEMYRRHLDQDVYLRALPLLSLADIDLASRRYRAAEAATREALETLEIALPDGHYITAVARCRIGRSLVGQGRDDEAAPFFDRAVPPLVDTLNAPEYRRECLAAAADYLDARGAVVEAARLRAALDDSGM